MILGTIQRPLSLQKIECCEENTNIRKRKQFTDFFFNQRLFEISCQQNQRL